MKFEVRRQFKYGRKLAWIGTYSHRHGHDGPYIIFDRTKAGAMKQLKALVIDDYEPNRGDEFLEIHDGYLVERSK